MLVDCEADSDDVELEDWLALFVHELVSDEDIDSLPEFVADADNDSLSEFVADALAGSLSDGEGGVVSLGEVLKEGLEVAMQAILSP